LAASNRAQLHTTLQLLLLLLQHSQFSGCGTTQGLTSHICVAYSLIVRSALNLPAPAVFMMLMRVHLALSLYVASTLSCDRGFEGWLGGGGWGGGAAHSSAQHASQREIERAGLNTQPASEV
jgi:hypothetical protein